MRDGQLGLALMLTASLLTGAVAWPAAIHTETSPRRWDVEGELVMRLKTEGRSVSALLERPSLWKGPVLPFAFGLWYYAFPHDDSILVFNVLMVTLAVGLLYVACRRLGLSQWTASLVLLAWVLYPPLRYLFADAHTEPFISFLSAGLFLLVVEAFKHPRARVAIAGGVVAGILVLARPPFAAVVAVVSILLIARIANGWKFALLFGSICLLTIAPWTIRNYVRFGEFIPFTTESGKILFQGTFVRGDGVIMNELRLNQEFRQLESGERAMGPIEQYRYWRGLALAQIAEDPAGQLRLVVRKGVRFVAYLPAHSWRPAWKTGAFAAVTLPLALIGFWVRRRDLAAQLCGVWFGSLWLTYALVHSELRYSFPVLPMYFMLAAFGTVHLLRIYQAARLQARVRVI